jgi:glycerophosphoryl diester phosphodiesterase
MSVIFAHRGASSEAPENTLPAFQRAIEQGCRAIELDVHLTRDGELIVCHDETIDRTTDGTGYIRDQTLFSLQQRDAGSWFSDEFQGTRLPTLDEVLEICHDEILINIEIKNIPFIYKGIEEKTLQTIRHFGFLENTIISSFDHHALLRVQYLQPNMKLGVLLANHLIDPWGYLKNAKLHAYSIHPLYTVIDDEFVLQSHKYGYQVFPFTVDERKVYQDLKMLGVDGVFTNIPLRFLE